MTQIDELFAANRVSAATFVRVDERRPRRQLAVLTCMDARIDVFDALGLQVGDAHILRNAGGRVTDDVLRSLALSCNLLGVDALLILQHTKCGLTGVTDSELQQVTGAEVPFLTISEHAGALEADLELVTSTPYLGSLTTVAGAVFDIESGLIEDVLRADRSGAR
jgi:carbonic anhydrase